MKDEKKDSDDEKFTVWIAGIIFDPSKKKILIWKREKQGHEWIDKELPKFTWGFIGGRAKHGEDVDKTLKGFVKERTGLSVSNLGAIFAKTFPENKSLITIYFLCESFEGKLTKGKGVAELKWVSPEELEKHFTTSFHPRLKEYLMNLK